MRTGKNGRIAICWDQTEIDGLEAAPLSFLSVGAAWSWRGQARFLAVSGELGQQRTSDVHGCTMWTLGHSATFPDIGDTASGLLVLTNGAQHFTATLFSVAGESTPTLVFENECPARDQEFWISEFTEVEHQGGVASEADDTIIAFPARALADDGFVALDHRSVANAGHIVD